MKNLKLFFAIIVALIVLDSVAYAAENISLNFNSSVQIRLNRTITRVFVASQKIVKISQPTPAMNEVMITSFETAGSTTVFLWTADGARYEYTVTVYNENVGEAAVIEREIGLPNVRVKKIGNRILLKGTVENEAEHSHAVRIAEFFAGGTSITTNPITGVQTTTESAEAAKANVIDELIVLNPSQNLFEVQVEQAISLPNVKVQKIGDSIMLTGTVETEREHIHAVQVATVFANNTKIENNLDINNNVKIMTFENTTNANVSKINIIDRIEVINKKTILEEEIEKAIGLPDVRVKQIDNRLLLTGTVQNQYERNYALQVARLFMGSTSNASLNFGSNVSPELETQGSNSISSGDTLADNKVESSGNIIDLLEMLNPFKIRLEAQVIEINSDKARDLGITYGQSGSGNVFSVGEEHDRTARTETTIYTNPLTGKTSTVSVTEQGNVENFMRRPLKWIEQRFGPINATIHALVSDGKARILSRPSVTTLSGEEAKIQIGGKIPYQSYSANGVINTSFENYGIILQFKPIVDSQNRISSSIHTEVSNLSGQTVNGQPIIATRLADSVVTLDSGSTIIIGGLMDSSESKAVSKIPLLGNIPILGEFFKYTSKRRDKRELIILVTPYLVEEPSRARMTPDMRDYYHAGQREKNSLNDIDLNAPPPPLPEKNKKSKSEIQKSDTKIFGDAF